MNADRFDVSLEPSTISCAELEQLRSKYLTGSSSLSTQRSKL